MADGSDEAKIPLPLRPGLLGWRGARRVGRSAASRIIGVGFCISEAMMTVVIVPLE